MNYDIVIAHRVSPALSKTSVGFTTKRDLVCSTTRSLAEALERFDGRIRLIVILDGCPPEYEAVFRRFFPDSGAVRMDFVRTPEIGNQATFAKQIEVLLAAEDADLVYFSEDDYLYAPDAFKAMAKFIRHSGAAFVTPLDHPDRYNQRLEKPRPSAIRVSAHLHWRTVGTSCLTFMTSRDVLLRSHEALETYARGAMDGTMWLGITKEDVFNPAILFRAAFFFPVSGQGGLWSFHAALRLEKPRHSPSDSSAFRTLGANAHARGSSFEHFAPAVRRKAHTRFRRGVHRVHPESFRSVSEPAVRTVPIKPPRPSFQSESGLLPRSAGGRSSPG